MVCSDVEDRLGAMRGQHYSKIIDLLGTPSEHGKAHYVYVLADCRLRFEFDTRTHTLLSYAVAGSLKKDPPAVEQEESAAEGSELKKVLAEHERRISELAATVAELKQSPPKASASKVNKPTAERDFLIGWITPHNWSRLQEGMSQQQVQRFLGPPTSMESVGSYRTLFYRGEVPGSGFISGNVKLNDDRVWDINVPVF